MGSRRLLGQVPVVAIVPKFCQMPYTNPLGMKKRNKLPEAALQFFREHGKVGGLKRAENLSAEQRSEMARKAIQVRWAKQAEAKRLKE